MKHPELVSLLNILQLLSHSLLVAQKNNQELPWDMHSITTGTSKSGGCCQRVSEFLSFLFGFIQGFDQCFSPIINICSHFDEFICFQYSHRPFLLFSYFAYDSSKNHLNMTHVSLEILWKPQWTALETTVPTRDGHRQSFGSYTIQAFGSCTIKAFNILV